MSTIGTWERTAKYGLLFALHILTGLALLVSLSVYATRIEIETEARAVDPNISFDALYVETQIAGEMARDIADYRCAERELLTLYRLSSLSSRRALSRIYVTLVAARGRLVEKLDGHGDILDLDKSRKQVEFAWGVPRVDELAYLPQATAEERSAFAAAFQKEIDAEVDKVTQDIPIADLTLLAHGQPYVPAGTGSIEAAPDLGRLMADLHDRDRDLFVLAGLQPLNDRVEVLTKAFQEGAERRNKLRPVLLRFANLHNLLDGHDPAAVARETVLPFADPQNGSAALAALDCDMTAGTMEVAGSAEPRGTAGISGIASFVGTAQAGPEATGAAAHNFARRPLPAPSRGPFGIGWMIFLPTSMLVLAVTLFAGSLGALTGSLLRMTRIGYWGGMRDPTVGDIVASMFQGASAAFIIFLLGSLGLVVLGDGQGAEVGSRSAYFIGVLGVISGLLNREAFARIREIGLKAFSIGGAGEGDGVASPVQPATGR